MRSPVLHVVSCLLVLTSCISAFAPQSTPFGARTRSSIITSNPTLLKRQSHGDNNGVEVTSLDADDQHRRRLVLSPALVAAATVFGSSRPAWAAAGTRSLGSSPDSPIVILGAGGKVGKLCTKILSDKGLYVKAVSRSGSLSGDNKFVSYGTADVADLNSLTSVLKGASGCIFAASASGKKKGGDPAHVDYLGAVNTAKACLANNVAKLVLISAGTATRPDSAGYKATNFFVKYVYGDNIMGYKIAGEAALRDLYASSGGGSYYTVIRPGGLSEKPSVGSSMVHVSQGDVYSSEVTREDVALVTVAALLSKSTDNATFELNQVEGLGKAMKELPDLPAELVHAGAPSYEALVDGLLNDNDIKKKYPDVINDFKGTDIESLDTLA